MATCAQATGKRGSSFPTKNTVRGVNWKRKPPVPPRWAPSEAFPQTVTRRSGLAPALAARRPRRSKREQTTAAGRRGAKAEAEGWRKREEQGGGRAAGGPPLKGGSFLLLCSAPRARNGKRGGGAQAPPRAPPPSQEYGETLRSSHLLSFSPEEQPNVVAARE